ncbi:uncharacterized protein LOC134274364 [Saccostrea cucullata]|uniref:uncharacterized protein LOC134274364 n=1 Tax=Saccostrea cuccullata TaxID=36930 RepID=UPI002ED2433C
MIGESNETIVFMNDNSFTGLVDSGSMVTTLSFSGYNSMTNQPELKDLSNLGLEVSVADGSLLKYKGYIECSVKIPFMDVELFVPVLIVPDTDFNRTCPMIIGTNVLRICRDLLGEDSNEMKIAPKEWRVALKSMQGKCYHVKSVCKKPIIVQPNESTVVKGRVRGLPGNNMTMVSENCDNMNRFTVCPRVVKFSTPNTKSTVQVKICNISAKPISVRHGTVLCNLQEVKVVDNFPALKPKSEVCDPIELGIKVDSSVLTEDQFNTVRNILKEYSHIFSTGPLDLRRTDLVKHSIELEDRKPFKQPYRRIPPGMYEEVRQHVREMLDAGVIRESNNNYSSNVVLCQKTDGSLRFCLDMRMLNSKTRRIAICFLESGIQTDPEKLSAVRDWPTPSNIKQLRQFLGFVGYYRRFIEHFAEIVAPLNALLQGHGVSTKQKRKKKTNKAVKWQWREREEEAFQTVKSKLLEPPILGFANYKLPFILHTDASIHGLGAVLYQVQQGKKRVIAYASRGLRSSERNYPAHKLEFLALKWAVSDKFHDYLYGTSFQVITDNNPPTYVLSKAKLDATSQRWVAALAGYDFTIAYRPGQQNADADGLSRKPELFSDAIKAICQSVLCGVPYCQTIIDDSLSDSACFEDEESHYLSDIHWRREQEKDKDLARVIELKKQGFYHNRVKMKKEDYSVQRFFREWKKLYLKDGILYRKAIIDEREVSQLVIPKVYREVAFQGIHRDTGHPGKEKTLWLARQRYF